MAAYAGIVTAYASLAFLVRFLVRAGPLDLRNSLLRRQLEMEARVGIEPTHKAFAEPCLTTWLPRHGLRCEN